VHVGKEGTGGDTRGRNGSNKNFRLTQAQTPKPRDADMTANMELPNTVETDCSTLELDRKHSPRGCVEIVG
jgi:hypothetical protein